MKKLVLTTTLALVALSATAAEARTSLSIGINEPVYPAYTYAPAPVYYEPAPAYYGPPVYYPSYYSGRDRHRNYDWRYWHEREAWERAHHDPHWHH